MNCKDCCQDCQRIGCDIEVGCSGYIEPSNGTKERMNERLEMMHKLYSDSEVKHFFSPSEPITNADHIRSMTDEELANVFAMISDCISCNCRNAEDNCNIVDGTCQQQWLKWLRQEV